MAASARSTGPRAGIVEPDDVYSTTVGELADIISGFSGSRDAGVVDGSAPAWRARSMPPTSRVPVDRPALLLMPSMPTRAATFVEMLKSRD